MPGPTPTVPSFDEVRLPEKISFGFSGGPEFFTSVSETQGGFEQRNVNRQSPLHTYRARYQFVTAQDFDVIKAFFMARRGKAVGFRFLDPGDFASDMGGFKDSTDGTLDTLTVAGTMTRELLQRVTDGALGVGDGVETQYQLVKTYLSEPRTGTLDHTGAPTLVFTSGAKTVLRSTGSWVTDGFTAGDSVCFGGTASNDRTYTISTITQDTNPNDLLTLVEAPTTEAAILNISALGNAGGAADLVRVITKPVRRADAVLAVRPRVDAVTYTEGGGGTGFSIDTTTGIITFNTAPPAGSVPDHDCLFDTPVRFMSDLFSASFEEFNAGGWENLEMKELRIA